MLTDKLTKDTWGVKWLSPREYRAKKPNKNKKQFMYIMSSPLETISKTIEKGQSSSSGFKSMTRQYYHNPFGGPSPQGTWGLKFLASRQSQGCTWGLK